MRTEPIGDELSNDANELLIQCLRAYDPNQPTHESDAGSGSGFDCDAEMRQLEDDLAQCGSLPPSTENEDDFSSIITLEPIKAIRASASKHVSKSYQMVHKLLASHNILSDGQYLREYNPETGAYMRHRSNVALVNQLLDSQDQMIYSLHQIEEIADRMLIEPSIYHEPDKFNAHDHLINTVNGVLDLNSMTLRSPSPEWLFTYAVDAHFISDCVVDDLDCPTFGGFCSSSLEGDPQKRQLLLEIIGFCLSDIPPVKAKCAFFLKGEPNSGKSVICEWLARLLDDDSLSYTALHELGGRFKRAELFGRKINICSEIKGSALKDITTFKKVTGGDRTDGEYKGGDTFYFSPHCKLVFAGNTLPHTTETDITRAFSNRMTVLLFNQSVSGEAKNSFLLDELLRDRNQIFTLAMYALVELRRRRYQFTTPYESQEYVLSYAEHANSVQMFIDDCCVLDPKQQEHNRVLFEAYREYCLENCLEPVKKGQFSEILRCIPRTCSKKFRMHGKNSLGRCGIGLKP